MPDTGNDAQVRAVAEQLFATWQAKQEQAAKETKRWFGGNLGSWLAAVALTVSAIAAGAKTHDLADDANTRSISNERSIAAMKADTSDRLARIETKIDLMMEERAR